MPLDLPKPVAAYFTADRDRGDSDAIVRCFTEDAVVKDEGRTHVGRSAIAAWKAEASTKYNYTSEPIALENAGDNTIVTSHLVGDFPGSPIDLRYIFAFDGDRIASLEIKV